jgi:hypothetical protein
VKFASGDERKACAGKGYFATPSPELEEPSWSTADGWSSRNAYPKKMIYGRKESQTEHWETKLFCLKDPSEGRVGYPGTRAAGLRHRTLAKRMEVPSQNTQP